MTIFGWLPGPSPFRKLHSLLDTGNMTSGVEFTGVIIPPGELQTDDAMHGGCKLLLAEMLLASLTSC
jgi:hypothetical protein